MWNFICEIPRPLITNKGRLIIRRGGLNMVAIIAISTPLDVAADVKATAKAANMGVSELMREAYSEWKRNREKQRETIAA
jgi:hypothetical protein